MQGLQVMLLRGQGGDFRAQGGVATLVVSTLLNSLRASVYDMGSSPT